MFLVGMSHGFCLVLHPTDIKVGVVKNVRTVRVVYCVNVPESSATCSPELFHNRLLNGCVYMLRDKITRRN